MKKNYEKPDMEIVMIEEVIVTYNSDPSEKATQTETDPLG